LVEGSKRSNAEKAQWYRELALSARQEARRCPKRLQPVYLAIAGQWEDMADVAEMLGARQPTPIDRDEDGANAINREVMALRNGKPTIR